MRAVLAIRQFPGINIPGAQLDSLLAVPSSVLPLHPQPQDEREHNADAVAAARGDQCGSILRRIFRPKGSCAQNAAQIPQTDKQPRIGGPRVLVEIVVVVPGMHEDGRDVGPPGHHEACKIRHALVLHRVDGGQDDHSDQRDDEGDDDVECALAEVIRGLADDEQDDGPDSVGGDGPEVCFDRREA